MATPEEWLDAADDLAEEVGRLVRKRMLEIDEVRTDLETKARAELRGMLQTVQDIDPSAEVLRRINDRARRLFLPAWRKFVGADTSGSGIGPQGNFTPSLQNVGQRVHVDAARIALRFLQRVGLEVPAETIRRVVAKNTRDMIANIRKAIERDAGSMYEVVQRMSSVPREARAGLLDYANRYRLNKGYWRLAAGAHIRATVRGLTAEVDAENYGIFTDARSLADLDPNNPTAALVYSTASRNELERRSAKQNADRSGGALGTWRDMGIHYGAVELYVPYPDDIASELTQAVATRRSAWLLGRRRG